MIQFEDITNQIGKLINSDIDLQNYCNTIFSSNLTVQDNTVVLEQLIPSMPSAEINKSEEIGFKNDEARQTGKSNIWTGNIVFFGNFEIDDETADLPVVAVETINGILTYKPSDIMRIIARKAGELIYEKIGCSNATQGVQMSNYKVMSETYYDRTSGTVGSYLEFELYRKNSTYN